MGHEQAAERESGGSGFVFDTLGWLDADSCHNSRYNGSATPGVVGSVDVVPGNCYGNPLYSFHPQFLEKPPFFNGLLTKQLEHLLDLGSAIPAPFKAAKVKLAAKSVPAHKLAKRTISASHIAKIKAAQKIRWAKYNAAKLKSGKVKAAPKNAKRKISPEGIARIKAAQKLRWAKIKAEKK